MSAPFGRATVGDDPREQPARMHGLLEKLLAAIRPEFRQDVLAFGPADPVLGGTPCKVAGCARTGRVRGLCFGHDHRWRRQGKPDPAGFIATTDPRLKGHQKLASCRASGCLYGRKERGLCTGHLYAWQRAGRPELDSWLAALPAAAPEDPPPACLISYCDLWCHADLPFCLSHGNRWRERGRPDTGEYARSYEDDSVPGHERIDLSGLSAHLRLEVQYALQGRHDDGAIKIAPGAVQTVVTFLAASASPSLLDRDEDAWRQAWLQRFPGRASPGHGDSGRALLVYARRTVEELHAGRGWDVEYPRDAWRLRNLGVSEGPATVRFTQVSQPWLKELAKRWIRWRLSSGTGAGSVTKGALAIARFSAFLASPAVNVTRLAQVDRELLERYLAGLHAELAGRNVHAERIGQLSSFLHAIRRLGWDDSLPASAMFHYDDYPKREQLLPRALAEHVMTQLEDPANLDRWNDPARRLITLILIRCGLRLGDALRLPFDCIVHDAGQAPYLLYQNHKMKREALVPIDEELKAQIADQQRRVRDRWPQGTPVLFPPGPGQPRRQQAGQSFRLPARARRVAAALRYPRRVRPAGPPDPASVSSHAGNPPDQHGRPSGSRPPHPRSRFSRDDGSLRPAVGHDDPPPLGESPQGQRRRPGGCSRPRRPSGRGSVGQAAHRPRHPGAPQRLLPAADGQELSACKFLLDLPDVRDHGGVPSAASCPAAGHAADHHRRRSRRP